MAILDIFKKKKLEKKEPVKKVQKKVEKKVSEVQPKAVKVKTKTAKPKKVSLIAPLVLKGPHVTEKATDLAQRNQYIFKVGSKSNKKDIKRSVEELYGVDVAAVRIVNVHPKERRLGKTVGERSGYKKAIVKVEKGQKIEVLPR